MPVSAPEIDSWTGRVLTINELCTEGRLNFFFFQAVLQNALLGPNNSEGGSSTGLKEPCLLSSIQFTLSKIEQFNSCKHAGHSTQKAVT